MKFLEILVSFLATQGRSMFQSNTEALSKTIVNNARRIAALLVGAVISTTLLCFGVSMGYTALIEGIDQGQGFQWSAGLIGGFVMFGIALSGLLYFLGERRWLVAAGIKEEAPANHTTEPGGPTLDTAFAMLVTELAINMKEKRHNAHDTSGDAT